MHRSLFDAVRRSCASQRAPVLSLSPTHAMQKPPRLSLARGAQTLRPTSILPSTSCPSSPVEVVKDCEELRGRASTQYFDGIRSHDQEAHRDGNKVPALAANTPRRS